MKNITQFDKPTISMLSDMLFSMMGVVASKYGLTVSRESGSYNPNSYTFKITFRTLAQGPGVAEGQPAEFAGKASQVGIPTDCWGKTLTYMGETYKVIDIKTRNHKYPVIAEKGGKRYKLSPSIVNNGLHT